MAGTIKVGGKTIATHDESTDVVSLASDVDISNLNISNNDFSNVDMSNMTFPAGHVVQVKHDYVETRTLVSNQTLKYMETSITSKYDNSQFIVDLILPVAKYSGYLDRDTAIAVGFKSSSASSSSSDYSSLYGTTNRWTRHEISGLNSFRVTDTQGMGGTGEQYWIENIIFKGIAIPNLNKNTTIYFATWISTDDSIYFGGSWGNSDTDSGQISSMTIYEVTA